MGELSEEKWNNFKVELEVRVIEQLKEKYKFSSIKEDLVLRYKEPVFLEVLDKVELDGPEIVGDWILNKRPDFNWEDESDNGLAEYYQVFSEALGDGEFDEFISEEIESL